MTLRWHVDGRAMHPLTRVYTRVMWWRREKEAFEGEEHTRATARRRQREGNASPTWSTRARARVRSDTVAGMRVWTVRPRRRTPRVRVVYFHGGGYIHPLTPDYWRLVRALSRAPAEVLVPAYPLAPDHTAEEVLPRLVDVVRWAEDRMPGLPTMLMGDSAGGAIALVLARRLARGGAPPVRVVALCPWLDATLDEKQVGRLEATDPVLAESGLRAAGRWWAGGRSPEDMEISPMLLPLDDLPPVDLYIGERDLLRPAVDTLAKRFADADDAMLTVHEVAAMFHVWMTREIVEGHRTRQELTRLVAAQTGSAS